MRDWIKKNRIVVIWGIVSILFALIINWAFRKEAPWEFLEAKWSPGDLLTYASTVSLGLLAIWQNQRFKEENDISQERMEKLTRRANELSAINKIIEHESEAISRLRIKIENFISACKSEAILEDLSDIANQPDDFKKIYVKTKMDNRIKTIRLCSIELLSELKSCSDEARVRKLIDLISAYGNCAIEISKKVRIGLPVDEIYMQKIDKEKDFIINTSDFIADREIRLNKIIYGQFTLDQIKEMYRKGLDDGGKS